MISVDFSQIFSNDIKQLLVNNLQWLETHVDAHSK